MEKNSRRGGNCRAGKVAAQGYDYGSSKSGCSVRNGDAPRLSRTRARQRRMTKNGPWRQGPECASAATFRGNRGISQIWRGLCVRSHAPIWEGFRLVLAAPAFGPQLLGIVYLLCQKSSSRAGRTEMYAAFPALPYSLSLAIAESLGSIVEGVR
jgi:hypothetical protein